MSRTTPEPDALDRELREAFRGADLPAAPLELRAQVGALPSSPRRVRGVPGGARFGRWPRSSALLGLVAVAVAIAVVCGRSAHLAHLVAGQPRVSDGQPRNITREPKAESVLPAGGNGHRRVVFRSVRSSQPPQRTSGHRISAVDSDRHARSRARCRRGRHADRRGRVPRHLRGDWLRVGIVLRSRRPVGQPGVVWTSSDGHSWSMSDRIPALRARLPHRPGDRWNAIDCVGQLRRSDPE